MSGVKVNSKTPGIGYTALHLSVSRLHFSIVKFLMESGADPNAEAGKSVELLSCEERKTLSCNPVTPIGFCVEIIEFYSKSPTEI